MAETAPRDDAAAETARVKFYGQDGNADDYHEEPAPLPRTPQNLFMEFIWWVLSFTIPGLGMFSEAYFVFSVGNLKPLFKTLYPSCWKEHITCQSNLTDTLNYSQVAGIIAGQLFIGFFADRLGRKYGSIMTAAIMFTFGIGITASAGNEHTTFVLFTIFQALYGVGVGGEYPVASTSANERAEQDKSLQHKRGQTVVLTFSMQGWGNLFNTLIILSIMAGFNQYGAPYDDYALEVTWRLSYALGLLPLGFILYWRIFQLSESAVWKKKRESLKSLGTSTAFNWTKTKILLWYYWPRIFGTALSWFVWDFAFYGNKLFQSTFIQVINPGAGLLEALEWTLLNSAVALVGYYFAAFTIDRTWMGRMRMQAMGFLWMCALFFACAGGYDELVTPKYIKVFQFLYYFSSFWGQFGPNATTWLLPAEVIPTEARSMCHGFAAAVGKAGALVAGVVFTEVDDRTKFWISGACGAAGAVLTVLLIPDLTGLDLKEGDHRWLALVEGDVTGYRGPAINPKHLSFVERVFFRFQTHYDPNWISPHLAIDDVGEGEAPADATYPSKADEDSSEGTPVAHDAQARI